MAAIPIDANLGGSTLVGVAAVRLWDILDISITLTDYDTGLIGGAAGTVLAFFIYKVLGFKKEPQPQGDSDEVGS